MNELQKQINELKEEQKAFIEVCQEPCKDCKLNELKERIGEIDKILIVITEGRILELQSITNLEVVIQELGKDYLNHAKEEHTYVVSLKLEKQLEKLDVGSARQTEKCEECGGHLFSGYLLHKGDCSHLHDKQEPREDDVYELYLKDGDQYYFKKTTHPFTEYNNMVNLGIGEMKMKREDLMKMIRELRYKIYGYDKEEWFTPLEKQSGYDFKEDLRKNLRERKDLKNLGGANN